MFLESIVMWLLAAFIVCILSIMYYEFTEYTGIPNGFEVAREILGGWILAGTLYIEEREERTDELGYKPFGLSM